MKAASINEVKKELQMRDHDDLVEMCLRLARYKLENKELLTYLLYEAGNEQAYVENIKIDLEELFSELPKGNTYFIKKNLRKILRLTNKQIKYSGIKQTELDVRIFFCQKVKEAKVPLVPGTVLYNLYHQQIKKIESVLSKLDEDIQADYERELSLLKR